MTDIHIKELVKAIEKATENASKSKETAQKFLREAGITNNSSGSTATGQEKKKK